MTLDEVRQLSKGAYVASPHDMPAYRIRRLSKDPWFSQDGTIARISLHSYRTGEWIPADAFVRAPGPETQFTWDHESRSFRRRGEQKGAA